MEKSRSITANNATIPDAGTDAGHSLWSDAWLRLRHNRAAMCGCAVLGLIILMCFIVPFLPALPDPAQQDLPGKNSTPSWSHWMGTDHLGRDLFSRILHGGRISILVGLITTMVSLTIGVAVGAVAGYLGGKVDAFLMRTVDILYSLPFLIIVILFSALAKGYTSDLTAEHLAHRPRLGAGHRGARVRRGGQVARPLPPAHPVFEATLSFLGMGVQPPYSSWGILIKDGADRMLSNPLLLIFPSIFFILTLLSLNFLGDGLRDALDPKSSKD
ncbi:MAG: ABC transporter permease [Akkermansiaceae bacterium]|nr:ABC transporter permease [Akkermansiaceae bacterium]